LTTKSLRQVSNPIILSPSAVPSIRPSHRRHCHRFDSCLTQERHHLRHCPLAVLVQLFSGTLTPVGIAATQSRDLAIQVHNHYRAFLSWTQRSYKRVWKVTIPPSQVLETSSLLGHWTVWLAHDVNDRLIRPCRLFEQRPGSFLARHASETDLFAPIEAVRSLRVIIDGRRRKPPDH
jgi:hypothetical protein